MLLQKLLSPPTTAAVSNGNDDLPAAPGALPSKVSGRAGDGILLWQEWIVGCCLEKSTCLTATGGRASKSADVAVAKDDSDTCPGFK
jgi:hypothetical protein